MAPSTEQQTVYRQIFQDYVNKRDTIRRLVEKPALTLSTHEEAKVRTIARQQYRQREVQHFKKWLCRFFSETNQYLTAIKMDAWPMMRRPK